MQLTLAAGFCAVSLVLKHWTSVQCGLRLPCGDSLVDVIEGEEETGPGMR